MNIDGAIVLGNGEWGLGGRMVAEEDKLFPGIIFKHLKESAEIGTHIDIEDEDKFDSPTFALVFNSIPDIDLFISKLEILKIYADGELNE